MKKNIQKVTRYRELYEQRREQIYTPRKILYDSSNASYDPDLERVFREVSKRGKDSLHRVEGDINYWNFAIRGHNIDVDNIRDNEKGLYAMILDEKYFTPKGYGLLIDFCIAEYRLENDHAKVDRIFLRNPNTRANTLLELKEISLPHYQRPRILYRQDSLVILGMESLIESLLDFYKINLENMEEELIERFDIRTEEYRRI